LAERAVEETFAALFALTDLRQVLRETKPNYRLSAEQKEKVRRIIDSVRHSLEVVEGELLR